MVCSCCPNWRMETSIDLFVVGGVYSTVGNCRGQNLLITGLLLLRAKHHCSNHMLPDQ